MSPTGELAPINKHSQSNKQILATQWQDENLWGLADCVFNCETGNWTNRLMICYFHTVLGILTVPWCFFPCRLCFRAEGDPTETWTRRTPSVFKTTCCTLAAVSQLMILTKACIVFFNNCLKSIQFLICPFSLLLYKRISASYNKSRYTFWSIQFILFISVPCRWDWNVDLSYLILFIAFEMRHILFIQL